MSSTEKDVWTQVRGEIYTPDLTYHGTLVNGMNNPQPESAQKLCNTINNLQSENTRLSEALKKNEKDLSDMLTVSYMQGSSSRNDEIRELKSQLQSQQAGLSAEEVYKFLNWLASQCDGDWHDLMHYTEVGIKNKIQQFRTKTSNGK